MAYSLAELTYMAGADGYTNPGAAAAYYQQFGKWPDKAFDGSRPPVTPTSPPSAGTGISEKTGPTADELRQIQQAIQNIAASEGVSLDVATKIFSGQMPRPSDGAYMTGAAGVPGSFLAKPGLDWATLEEATRSAQAREQQARDELGFQKGSAIGQVDGKNTLESVKYANEILANPQNAALAEMIRKGYALGPQAGETVAEYLNRSLEGPQAGNPGSSGPSTPPSPSPQPSTPSSSSTQPSTSTPVPPSTQKPTTQIAPAPVTAAAPRPAAGMTLEQAQAFEAYDKQVAADKAAPPRISATSSTAIAPAPSSAPATGKYYGFNTPEEAMAYATAYAPKTSAPTLSTPVIGGMVTDGAGGGVPAPTPAQSRQRRGSGPPVPTPKPTATPRATSTPTPQKKWTQQEMDYINAVAKAKGEAPKFAAGGFYGFQQEGDTDEAAAQKAIAFRDMMQPYVKDYAKTIMARGFGEPEGTNEWGRFGSALRGVDTSIKGEKLRGRLLNEDPSVTEAELQTFYRHMGGDDKRDLNAIREEIMAMQLSPTAPSRESLAVEGATSGLSGLEETLNAYRPKWYESFIDPHRIDIQSDMPRNYRPPAAVEQRKGDYTGRIASIMGKQKLYGPRPENFLDGDVSAKDFNSLQMLYGEDIANQILAIVDEYGKANPPQRAKGGSVVVGGQPHWIVDNNGVPKAALTEDGKPEAIVGDPKGVEVIPLDPARRAAYEMRKRMPGMGAVPGMAFGGNVKFGTSARTAPSRRPGASANNNRRTQSGDRAVLPDDTTAKRSKSVGDARANNGRNQGRGEDVSQNRSRQQSRNPSDRDAQSVRRPVNDIAQRVEQRINMPTGKPQVTPGAKYMAPVASIQPVGPVQPVQPPQMSIQPIGTPVPLPQQPQTSWRVASSPQPSWQKIQPVGQPQLPAFAYGGFTGTGQDLNTTGWGDSFAKSGYGNDAASRWKWLAGGRKPLAVQPRTSAPRPVNTVRPQPIGTSTPIGIPPSVGAPMPIGIPGGPPPANRPPSGGIFIGSGGDRTIGNNIAGARFGFDAGASSAIAGQNQRIRMPNNPGVGILAAHKITPETLRKMTAADRAMFESQIRASGQDPQSYFEQAAYVEPQGANTGRSFI